MELFQWQQRKTWQNENALCAAYACKRAYETISRENVRSVDGFGNSRRLPKLSGALRTSTIRLGLARRRKPRSQPALEGRRKSPREEAIPLVSKFERHRNEEVSNVREFMEARVGIEPTRKGFADLSLTTWVPRRQLLSISKIQARLQSRALQKLRYFFAVVPIRASRRKRADSSGGVGLM